MEQPTLDDSSLGTIAHREAIKFLVKQVAIIRGSEWASARNKFLQQTRAVYATGTSLNKARADQMLSELESLLSY